MQLTCNEIPDISLIIELYKNSGIVRPVDDYNRIKKMYENSNLVVCAYEKGTLVGIGRALTDFSYCCYLSDIAVSKEYQNKGIGSKIISYIREIVTTECTFLLLSSPEAMGFYKKIGLNKSESCFIKRRKV